MMKMNKVIFFIILLLFVSCSHYSKSYKGKKVYQVNELDYYPKIESSKMNSLIVYPKYALKNKLNGFISLDILINKNGDIVDYKAKFPYEKIFLKSAIDALREFGKIEIGVFKGEKVPYWANVKFTFYYKNYINSIITKQKEDKRHYFYLEDNISNNSKVMYPDLDIKDIQSKFNYPEEAQNKSIEGFVILDLYLNENGNIEKKEILFSDDKILANSALKSIEAFTKFEPLKINGNNVACWFRIPIKYELN